MRFPFGTFAVTSLISHINFKKNYIPLPLGKMGFDIINLFQLMTPSAQSDTLKKSCNRKKMKLSRPRVQKAVKLMRNR